MSSNGEVDVAAGAEAAPEKSGGGTLLSPNNLLVCAAISPLAFVVFATVAVFTGKGLALPTEFTLDCNLARSAGTNAEDKTDIKL